MRKKLLSILATTFIVISASAGEITAVTVTQNSDYTGRKNQYEPIISSKIDISGSDTKLQSVTLTLDGTTDIGDYAKVKIYSTGTDATFDERTAANAWHAMPASIKIRKVACKTTILRRFCL